MYYVDSEDLMDSCRTVKSWNVLDLKSWDEESIKKAIYDGTAACALYIQFCS